MIWFSLYIMCTGLLIGLLLLWLTTRSKQPKAGNAYKYDNNPKLLMREYSQEYAGHRPKFKILNERPQGMKFEKYKELLKLQKQQIKEHRRGRLVYLAVQMVKWINKAGKTQVSRQTWNPFWGDTHRLKDI